MAKIRDGSTYLRNHLSCNDYYAEGEKVLDVWQGRLARQWGIEGQSIAPDDRRFEALRRGFTPDGCEKLTQRGGGNVRFIDFQCSAHKSVSIMWMLDDRLAHAHSNAAKIAFAELERFAARRVRDGASAWSEHTELTGSVCAAVFRHDASRALDPQLHTHHVIANATITPGCKRFALSELQMVRAVRYAGKVYQNELARRVRTLGYRIRATRDEKARVTGWEIVGVSDALIRQFSKRRADILKEIAVFVQDQGVSPTSGQRAVMARETRETKLASISTSEVRRRQLAQLSESDRETLLALVVEAGERTATHAADGAEREVANAAISHCFERKSVCAGHELLAEALNFNLGGIDLDALKAELFGNPEAVRLTKSRKDTDLSAEWASREGLAFERWSVDFVNRTQSTCRALAANAESLPGIRITLSDEQEGVVRFVTTSRAQVMGIRGIAGAGKTTTLLELDRRLDGQGHCRLYLAPTRGAVNRLKEEGFSAATTVSHYLIRSKSGQESRDWRGGSDCHR